MSAFAGTPSQSVKRHGPFWATLASAWVAGFLLAGAVYTSQPPKLPTISAPTVAYLADNEFAAVSFIKDGANAATAPASHLRAMISKPLSCSV